MDRYRLKIDNDKNFSRLLDGLDKEIFSKLSGCILREVIVTPAINLWQIILRTDKDFDKQSFRVAEEFLRRRYNAEVEIRQELSIADEFVPTEKKSPRKKFSGRRKRHKKIFRPERPQFF